MEDASLAATETSALEDVGGFQPDLKDAGDFQPTGDAAGEIQMVLEDGGEFKPVLEDSEEFQPVLEDSGEFQPVLKDGGEFQPVLEDGREFQPVLEDGGEFQPAMEDAEVFLPDAGDKLIDWDLEWTAEPELATAVWPQNNGGPSASSTKAGIFSSTWFDSEGKKTRSAFLQWASESEYKCLECCHVFHQCKDLIKHLIRIHTTIPTRYKQKHGISVLRTKTVYRECPTCGARMISDKEAMYGHAKTHGMNVQQLYEFHLQKDNIQVQNGEEAGGSNESAAIAWLSNEFNEAETLSGSLVGAGNFVSEYCVGEKERAGISQWSSESEYLCLECGFVFHHPTDIVKHLTNVHKTTSTSYKKKHCISRLRTKTVTRDCPVCRRQFISDHSAAYKHAKTHNMTVKQLHQCHLRKTMYQVQTGEEAAITRFSNEFNKGETLAGSSAGAGNFVSEYCLAEEKAGITRWSAESEYRCLECGHIFKYATVLIKHLTIVHKTISTSYKKKHGIAGLMTKTVYRDCPVCRGQFISDHSAAYTHAKTHNMTVKQLYEYHLRKNTDQVQNGEEEVMVIDDPEDGTDMAILTNELNVTETSDDSGQSMSPWTKCEFQCLDCRKMYCTGPNLKRHLMTDHKMTIAEYKKNHNLNTPMTKKVMYTCPMCSAVIVWDYSSIRAHVLMRHQKSLDNWFIMHHDPSSIQSVTAPFTMIEMEQSDEQIQSSKQSSRPVKDYPDTFYRDCPVCGVQFMREQSAANAHAQTHGKTVKQLYKMFLEKTTDQMQNEEEEVMVIDNTEDNKDIASLTNEITTETSDAFGLSKKEVARMKWRKCEFQCLECNIIFTRTEILNKHLKLIHKMNVVEYKNKYNLEVLMTKKVMYNCAMCNSEILWDYSSIRTHVIGKHNLSWANWLTKYQEDDQSSSRPTLPVEDDPEIVASLTDNVIVGEHLHYSGGQASFHNGQQWARKCEFQCLECCKIHDRGCHLTHHLRNAHKMSIAEYKSKHNLSGLMTKKVKYTCHMCHSVMAWDYGSIRSHALLVHQKSLSDWFTMHHDTISIQSSTAPITMMQSEEQIQHIETSLRLSESPRASLTEVCAWASIHYSGGQASGQPGFSQWATKCEFQCLECCKIHYRGCNLTHHLMAHKMSIAEYKSKHNLRVLMTKKVMYTCPMCNSVIVWDYGSIRSHALLVHQKSLSDWFTMHHDTSSIQSSTAPITMIETEQSEEQIQHIETSSRLSDSPRASVTEVCAWASRCQYKCLECNTMFFEGSKLKRHLSNCHNLGPATYKVKHNLAFLMTKQVLFVCPICKSAVQWRHGSLRSHALQTHKITLEELHARHCDQNSSEQNPTLSEDQSETICIDGEEFVQTGDPGGRSEDRGDEVMMREESSGNQVATHLKKKTFFAWASKCEFKCLECEKMCNTSKLLSTHLMHKHKLSVHGYKSKQKLTRLMTKKVSHPCPKCGKKIVWNYPSLRLHAELKHKITLREMYETFSSVGPKSAIPEEQDCPVSITSWASKCQFSCLECNKMHFTYRAMEKHIRFSHRLSPHEYKEKHNVTGLMTKRVYYTCPICKSHITWECTSITQHAVQVHKITLKEMSIMSSSSSPTKDEAVPRPPNRKGIPEEQDRPISSALWASKCQFSCLECNKMHFTYKAFGEHIRFKHRLSSHEYKQKHHVTGLMTQRFLYTCPICKAHITWEKSAMTQHAAKAHKLTLKEMCILSSSSSPTKDGSVARRKGIYSWASKCQFKCLECHIIHFRSRTLSFHLGVEHKLSVHDYKMKHKINRLMTKKVMYNCPLCKLRFAWDYNVMARHAEKEHSMSMRKMSKLLKGPEKNQSVVERLKPSSFSQWLNVYRCEACRFRGDSWTDFDSHVTTEHNLSVSEYGIRFGSVLVTTQWHRCMICKINMAHNADEMRKHFGSAHQITAVQYYEKYIASSSVEMTVDMNTDDADDDWMTRPPVMECAICEKTFSEAMIASHVQANHYSESGLYSLLHGQPKLRLPHFSCRVCAETMPHSEAHIREHLLGIHNQGRDSPILKHYPQIKNPCFVTCVNSALCS
jgi:predicted transcriptional regulator